MPKSKNAEGRNRTGDTMIFSHVLYRLSYLGAGPLLYGPVFGALTSVHRTVAGNRIVNP